MYTPSLRSENGKAVGFTLLELLIVIGIMVILGTVLVLVLNPAETLKKTRDNQRISDLATMKTAIGLYVTNTVTPLLDNTSGNTTCASGTATDTIYYSIGSDTTNIADSTLDNGSGSVPIDGQVTAANLSQVSGSGWIPIAFTGLTGGSPISALPIDPTNTVTTASAVTSSDLVYRYKCDASDLTFEMNAKLESTAYTLTDNKMTKDGGNNDNYYEAGTKLTILGAGGTGAFDF
ncbi:MAG: type II secretion system protein [bacterium]|nr:type II secretion system protein [bacterium]